MSQGETSRESGRPGPRWWPLALVVAGVAARWIQVWYFKDFQRQYKVMGTGVAILVGLALALVWLLTVSRIRWKTRWKILGGAVAAVLAGVALFRYEGVTGDLIPILEPRWRARAAAATRPPSGNQVVAAVPEQSFPQYLGPTRDGVITGVRLARDWETRRPQVLWRQPVGEGFGGFAVVGRRALTQEQEGGDETVRCYDLLSGQRLWEQRVAARYGNPIGGVGPRSTPTVVGSRVFTMGATGWLHCLELETGRVIWGTNLVGTIPDQELEWGVSGSPLVYSNLVVVAPRGQLGYSLAALHAETGAMVWTGGKARPHYSSPRLDRVLGVAQILTFTETAAAAHDPATGALLWEHGWRPGHPHVSDPRVVGTNLVLVSSGYGTGSRLVSVTRDEKDAWSATNVVWRSMRLKSKFANILLRDGVAYGLDDGRLVCMDLNDGQRRWEGERYGHGQLLDVGSVLLLTSEEGDVVLVDADPGNFRERARFRAVEGKTWNPPALAGEILVVRNDREAAAYRLPLEP